MTDELLTLARVVAVEAAELAARKRTEGVSVEATKSSVVDVVTAADREVEHLIRDRLAEARPGDGFYGEESTADAGTTGLTWIVDPIDGTVNYLYGIPHYAVSIAVVEGPPERLAWHALAGCVVNGGTGEVFTATDGGGAFLGSRRLRLGPPPPFEQSLIGTGFGYSAQRRREQGAVAARLLPQVRDIRRMGAAALDICAVAAGRLDAFYEGPLSPWDYAAGVLVASEAGARAMLVDSAAGHGFLVVAHPGILDPLLAALGDDPAVHLP